MSVRNRLLRSVSLVATAIGGVLVAHELDYRLVVPDPLHRHDLLMRSGHGYLSHLAFILLAAFLMASIASVALGFVGARTGTRLRGTALPLAIVQAGSFVLLEAAERLIVGSPPNDRLFAVTAVGVAVQVVVGFLGALLIRALERAGGAVARLRWTPPRSRAVRHAAPRVPALVPRGAVWAWGIRGPPLVVG
ncbi:MAG TPA: hypothetical protein VGB83_09380 [Actinomycetota bacterium]